MVESDIVLKLLSEQKRDRNTAYEYLYKKFYITCKKYVIKNSGTESDAADVFQDSLLVLYTKLNNKPDLNIDLGAYLFGINRNIWLKKLKKSPFTRIEHTMKSHELSEAEVLYEDQLSVRDALNKLDTQCRQLLLDFYFGKQSMAQISDSYGLAGEKVAKNKKYRCLQKLITYVKKNKLNRTDFSDE